MTSWDLEHERSHVELIRQTHPELETGGPPAASQPRTNNTLALVNSRVWLTITKQRLATFVSPLSADLACKSDFSQLISLQKCPCRIFGRRWSGFMQTFVCRWKRFQVKASRFIPTSGAGVSFQFIVVQILSSTQMKVFLASR